VCSSDLDRERFFWSRHGREEGINPGVCCTVNICRNRNGFRLDGVPVHVVRSRYVEKGRRYGVVVVNLFDRPPDFRTFVPRLLALVPKRGRVVVAYPVEWTREFRRAARAAIPKLRQNHGCWFSAWRIYGKRLKK
jgi:hypothetical protein